MRAPARSAAILAGGRASRFGGRDKSLLTIDGRTIFDRQLSALTAVEGVDDVMLVGAGSARPGTRLVADTVPGSGPLGGIHAALTDAQHDAVCILACDMPYVTAELVSRLFADLPGADIVVPRDDRGYHPLCAVYARACVDAIARRLADRKLKVLDLFADVRTRVVTLVNGDRRLVANVNTPEAFAALDGHCEA
jgi:molybdopterin-guanine dinucleotide biosynthesis protein A